MAVAMDTGMSANDQPTPDLLTQHLDIHAKNAWVLRSLLKR